MLLPPFLCQNPGPIRHRRLMTHMLTMAALEVGHPIAIFIQMITNNWLLHAQASLTSASNERAEAEVKVERRPNAHLLILNLSLILSLL